MEHTILRLVAEIVAAATTQSDQTKEIIELVKTVIVAAGPIIAAIIVAVAGTTIAHYYTNERERQEREAADIRNQQELEAANRRHQQELEATNMRHQLDLEALKARHQLDKESEWRSHAVELTKLDFQRILKAWKPGKGPMRPVILDFLAVYRDLKELDYVSPKDLYETIRTKRINPPQQDKNPAPEVQGAQSAVVTQSTPEPQADTNAQETIEGQPLDETREQS